MPNTLTVLIETIVPTILGALIATLPYVVEKLGERRRDRRKGAAGLVPAHEAPERPGAGPHGTVIPWQTVILILGAGYVFGVLTVVAWPTIFPEEGASEVAIATTERPPQEEEVAEAEMPAGEATSTVAGIPGPTVTPPSGRTATPAVRDTAMPAPTATPSASEGGRPFSLPPWLWPALFAIVGFAIGRWIVRRLQRG
jgi:hypothetical protein